jgi:hypothetical protein
MEKAIEKKINEYRGIGKNKIKLYVLVRINKIILLFLKI